MQASQTRLLPFLEGTRQFVIPIYQRPYSWTQEQCKQLWNDILAVGTDDKMSGHFVGSIVFIQGGLYQTTKMVTLLVIDGQQRLTTITLLLIALAQLAKHSASHMEISYEEIYDSYLTNHHGKGDQYYKLLLTQNDREVIKQLIGHPVEEKFRPEAKGGTNRLIRNYQFFVEQLAKDDVDLQKIYLGISKLVIVEISLDKHHDHPQLIFESMNSTGVDLTQSDLIRNYVFMGLSEEEQEFLYKEYWLPMEQNFYNYQRILSPLERRQLFRPSIMLYNFPFDLFDSFIQDYLTVKTHSTPPVNRVYSRFKLYRQSNSSDSIEKIVADIYKNAIYYVKIVSCHDENEVIRKALQDIKSLGVSLPYPLILMSYEAYAQQKISRDDFVTFLRFLETYFFRRIICGLFISSSTFREFYDQNAAQQNHITESLYKWIASSGNEQLRLPSDDEFKIAFITKDIYHLSIRNYILSKLENHRRKELVNIESYTIEHIMPQSIGKSDAWKKELGQNWKKIHSRFLHTIGNLTLTGYNSELSNHSFIEKRDMEGGFVDSPIRLNRSLAKLDNWNEEQIQNRAQTLADLALEIWSTPSFSLSKFKKPPVEKEKSFSLKDHKNLKGTTMKMFEHLRKRIMNLDASVKEDIREHYIVYKASSDFVYVTAKKDHLVIFLDIPFAGINDPKSLCQESSNPSLFNLEIVELKMTALNQIEDAMDIVRQSYEKHLEGI